MSPQEEGENPNLLGFHNPTVVLDKSPSSLGESAVGAWYGLLMIVSPPNESVITVNGLLSARLWMQNLAFNDASIEHKRRHYS